MSGFSAILVGNEVLTRHAAETLIARGHRIAAVVTRNAELRDWAQGQGLPVEDQDAPMPADAPVADWLFSVANLSILKPDMLARGQRGAINFHDGPLPGMAGINVPVWAILEGRDRHAITWHLIAEGIDTGDVLALREFEIDASETALTLNAKCFVQGSESFDEILNEIERGTLSPRPQAMGARGYFARDKRPDAAALLDLRQPAERLARLVRALDHGDYWNPLARPKLALAEGVALVARAEIVPGSAAPGTVLARKADELTVAVGDGALRLDMVPGQAGLPEVGAQLPVPDDAARARIEALAAPVARQDGFWRRQLAKTALGRADVAQGDWANIAVSEQPASPLAVAAAVALLARRGAGGALSMALRPANHPETLGILSEWLPLTIAPEGLLGAFAGSFGAHVDQLAARGPFAADLLHRAPELHGASAPEIGLDLAGRGAISGTAFTVSLGPTGVTLHHDSTRLDAEEAQRLADRLARAIMAPADAPVSAIGALDPAQRDELLYARNDSLAAIREVCIHSLIAETAAADGAATAVIFQDRSLTRAQLQAAANRLARQLVDQGVGPDQPVGLFARRGPELVIGALAIMKAGGAYLPLDPDYPQDRLTHYLTDSGTRIVLTQPGLSGLPAGHGAQLIPIEAIPPAEDPGPPDSAVGPEHLAYLIYTSGSTGKPKGVMVEHRNVANFFAGMDAIIPAQPGDAWLAVTSLSFDISVLEIFWSLARGLTLVIAGEESRLAVSGNAAPKSRAAMDFSLFYWGNDDGVGPKKYELLLAGARFADQNGFAALWTPERHFHAFGGPYPNPAVTGAAAAAVTSRLGIRAGSCVVPLHHPARVAEEWAVIDNLTGGRAAIAVASGWQPDDFVLRPENTPPRNKQAMIDTVDVLRRLWRGEEVEFPKADGTMHAVRTQPRPVSPELPIWVTVAGNPETWKEAGRLGANVLTHLLGQSIDVVEQRIKDYHEALREAGHDPADFTVTLMLHSYLAADRETAREVAREPMKDYLRAAAALVKQYAWDFPAFKRPEGMTNPMAIDLGSLSDEEMDGILEFAFLRYFEDSGLFGSVQDAITRVEQLQRIGVGEIACLIDYGIAPDVVQGSFPLLAQVAAAFAGEDAPDAGDFSIAAQIRRHKVTHLQCTPSMARILVTDPTVASAMACLRCVMIGGEALPPSLVRDLRAVTGAEILNMYGPTETTIWSSVARLAPDQDATPLGPPIANTQLYVLDEAGQPLGDGEEGELWIGGHGVTRGYWNRADLTAAAFRADPFVRDAQAAPGGKRMYRTGDLVRWRGDGQMDFLGRADGQIKLRGFRIELGEIESRLAELPGVREAVVILRPDTSGQGRLLAYVTGDEMLDEAHMRAGLQDLLPQHMLPARITRLSAMPLTPNRKIDRKALPEPAAPVTQTAAAVVSTPAEAPAASMTSGADPSGVVHQVWAETLGLQSVGAKDNFFAIGGHSLLAIQLHRVLRDRLALASLGVTDVFRFPVLADYQRHVAKLSGVGSTAASPKPAPVQAAPITARADAVGSVPADDDPMARRRALRAQLRNRE
ncbi:LLM class flavin-dependent oxidoreductase [Paracoccus sp. M683]|uniref:MupA/Atu3671 family FMN-dependent luciferase-like monooxygenase n=1 Tax=Paracoccus sp. M683 TaxID=2594268 RepID=UPI00118078B3|nr:MupA/Atu3671 family FMN-dependent luciferase-like monooxygenase [Paracoccus sp. M683]TRW95781.1 LLM class flavin-dependent oxidoreductase [Paracoccus sp. M683]